MADWPNGDHKSGLTAYSPSCRPASDRFFCLDLAKAAVRRPRPLPVGVLRAATGPYQRAISLAHSGPIIDRDDRLGIARFTGEIGGILHPPSTLYPGVVAPPSHPR